MAPAPCFCCKFSCFSAPGFLTYPYSVACFILTALLKENSATNQYALLTLVENTVVIGNYTKPNVSITVPLPRANTMAEIMTFSHTSTADKEYSNLAT